MGLRGVLTRIDVSLDGWDIVSLIGEGNDRLEEILQSWERADSLEDESLAQHGRQISEEVWDYWWDTLTTLHDAQRRLDEQIANR